MTSNEQEKEISELLNDPDDETDFVLPEEIDLQAVKKGVSDQVESLRKLFLNLSETDQQVWIDIFESVALSMVKNINPEKIPPDLLEDKTIKKLATEISTGDIDHAKETLMHMNRGKYRELRNALDNNIRYKNVPIEILSDFVTNQIFTKQAPSGSYVKEFKRGNKVIATLDYALELSEKADTVGVYERIINAAVYTLMKKTNSNRIDGAQLYRIMTNDPDAKLTPRTIENIIHSIDQLTTVKIKCARVNIFDDPETPSMDVYRQIFRYDFLTIIRKADGTPKNFQIVMTEPPLTAMFAEQLHQISEKPFGFYQLPIGNRATKKNMSLIYELLRLIMIKIEKPEYEDPNLDELMKKCGFDITDRDETKKARDLITAILKGREDTKKNRQKHPEIVIENYSGFEWKINKRTGKRTNIKIKNTGIKGDATTENTGIKGDAVSKNTGIKGDATRPKRNHKKRHK